MKPRELFQITWFPIFVAGLCCFTPVVLVALGLATVSYAASLSNILYGRYDWAFQLAELLLLVISVTLYLRREKGICTLDDVRRRLNEVINIASLVLIVGVIGYLIWLYGIVEIMGALLGIW